MPSDVVAAIGLLLAVPPIGHVHTWWRYSLTGSSQGSGMCD
jgi:hypothetical protein